MKLTPKIAIGILAALLIMTGAIGWYVRAQDSDTNRSQTSQTVKGDDDTVSINFKASDSFTDEEKQTITERVIDPKVYYETMVLKDYGLRSIDISRTGSGYALDATYGNTDTGKLGFVFGEGGQVEYWTPRLCDPGGCLEYPVEFKAKFPGTFAAYAACQAKNKESSSSTIQCVEG